MLSRSWPYGPAIAATAADFLDKAIVMLSLPFFLSNSNSSSEGIGLPEDDIPRWSSMIISAQFAAVVLGSLLSGRMGDKYGSAAAVKLALIGQTFFFALSAFAPFGFVGDPTLRATLLLFTRIGAGVATALVSALLYIFDRAPSSEARLSHQPCGPKTRTRVAALLLHTTPYRTSALTRRCCMWRLILL